MKKRFRSLPARITAAILTAGLIVSSSNLDYVRFILPGVENVSQVEAEDSDEKILTFKDPTLQKAVQAIVNYKIANKDENMANKHDDFTSDTYKQYWSKTITVGMAQDYNDGIDLSGCPTIQDISGLNVFSILKSIDISNYSGNSIPDGEFQSCKQLEKVVISNKVNNIGAASFQKCNALNTIEVKGATDNKDGFLNLKNIDSIGSEAFAENNAFVGVNFDETNYDLSIGSSAFSQCTKLEEITVPTNNYAKLGLSVFYKCTSLKNVHLNDDLEVINASFFRDAKLSEMNKFPKNLKSINEKAFEGTRLLTPDLTGCDQLVSIGEGAFQGITYTPNTPNVFKLPDSLIGDSIQRIAFFGSTLESIDIPSGITVIPESCFEGCRWLTNVKIADGSKLEKIDDWAFRRCWSLDNTDFIKDLENLTSIGKNAFSECYELLEVYDENGNLKLFQAEDDESFDNHFYYVIDGLTEVTLPDSLTNLGEYAFANNYNLNSIKMGKNLNEIPNYAFALSADTKHEGCSAKDLEKKNYADYNPDETLLSYSSKMTNVKVSQNLKTIGIEAFSHNANLSTVTYEGAKSAPGTLLLPDSVKTIKKRAFADCARWSERIVEGKTEATTSGLTKIDISNLVLDEFEKGVFENDLQLNTAILPKNLSVIPEELFKGCGKRLDNNDEAGNAKVDKFYGLETVEFPENVTKISKSAFQDCVNFRYNNGDAKYLDEYYKLPNTLEEIDDNAFSDCQNIGSIALNTKLKKIGANAFYRCSVHLPDNDDNTNYVSPYGLTKILFSPALDLKEIGENAFACTAITNADLSSNTKVEKILNGMFSNCYNLITSELPYSASVVEANVYANNVRITKVQLPAIATVAPSMFSGIPYKHFRDKVTLTLNSFEENRKVIVPIGQEQELKFIKSSSPKFNEYSYVQSVGDKELDESEWFVGCKKTTDGGVSLYGNYETDLNSTLKVTNKIFFTVKYNDSEDTDEDKELASDFKLTVTDVYANELNITGVEGEDAIPKTENEDQVLNISAEKITGDDQTNSAIFTASVKTTPLSKAPVWGSSDNNIISVDSIDPSDKNILTALNESSTSKAKIHVKGVGEAKLWISNGVTGKDELKKEITVRVKYPVNPETTTISVKSLESDTNEKGLQLEAGGSDKITVTPGYSEEESQADSANKAKIYFESTEPSVATVDNEGNIKVADEIGEKTETEIKIIDETGKVIKSIPLKIVDKGSLSPNIVKISPENKLDLYANESKNVTAKVYPSGASQDIVWSLDPNSDVLENDYAKIIDNGSGSATVTAKARTDGEVRLYVKAKENPDAVSSIILNVSVPVTTLKFQKPSAEVAVDATLEIGMATEPSEELALLYQPAEASNNAVTWEIKDKSIANFVDTTNKVTLYDGIPAIIGIKQGTTKLTATTANGKTASIDINVYQPLTDFSVEESKTVHKGDTFKLKVDKTPAGSSEQFVFSSSDENIATVDSQGNVKAVAEGQVSINVARISNGESKYCTVTVIEKVNTISILDSTIEINVEGTYSIGKASDGEDVKTGYRLSPNSSDVPTWTSSNPQIASVEYENGNVTIKGVAPGSATITATMLSGATTSITVNVVSVNTELKFTEESKNVAVGTQTAVTLTKNPAEATEGITYSSSDETIAKVDENGVVTGVAKGNATITATGKVSGVSTSITINVTVPATGVKLVTTYASEKKIYLVKGSSYQLQYKLLPEDSTDTVKYSTNKKKIASVSEDGTITAKKKGNATITVVTESGKKTTLKVYVVKKEKNAKKIKIKTSSIKVGQTVKLKYTVTAATTTNTLSYSVNKPNIAEIDEYGYITGLKKGKVKVTVTASNGKKKTKTIKVK